MYFEANEMGNKEFKLPYHPGKEKEKSQCFVVVVIKLYSFDNIG